MADSPSYYQPGAARAERVQALFGRIARRYDLINDVQSLGLHRRWKRRLVQWTGVGSGQRVLDVCCGTGDVTRALAATGADAVGLDFSEPMLAVARGRQAREEPGEGARARAGGRTRGGALRYVRGDALAMPFADAEFDAVTISYGLRNLASLDGGLAEMGRVLRPGGRLVVLDFGKPANRLWRALYFGYLRWAVPVLGWCACGDSAAYGYILESLVAYPGPRGVAERMTAAGWSNVRVEDRLGGAMGLNYGERPAAR